MISMIKVGSYIVRFLSDVTIIIKERLKVEGTRVNYYCKVTATIDSPNTDLTSSLQLRMKSVLLGVCLLLLILLQTVDAFSGDAPDIVLTTFKRCGNFFFIRET